MFTRLHYKDAIVYHVSVFGQFFNIYFTMNFVDDEWQFVKPDLIGDWVKEVKTELIETFEANHP